jgi:hypothetical protein
MDGEAGALLVMRGAALPAWPVDADADDFFGAGTDSVGVLAIGAVWSVPASAISCSLVLIGIADCAEDASMDALDATTSSTGVSSTQPDAASTLSKIQTLAGNGFMDRTVD